MHDGAVIVKGLVEAWLSVGLRPEYHEIVRTEGFWVLGSLMLRVRAVYRCI